MARQAQTDARTGRIVGRLSAAVEAVAERARQAEEGGVRQPDTRHIEQELRRVEGYIREMSGAFLGMEGGQELARLKEVRRALRQEMEEATRPYQALRGDLRTAAWQLENALKRLPRLTDEREKLRVLVAALEAVGALPSLPYGFFPYNERRALWEAASHLRLLDARPEEPAPAATVVEEIEPDAESIETYLPPASELEFDPDDRRVIERFAAGRLDPPADYRLNLAAQHLSLVGGFDVLLCLPLLRGVEQFPFQVNTARQVLRTMRGRALLCDEVGLGKTIEAGLALKEYLVRGLVRRALVLVPPALVSQWREEMREKFGIPFVTHEDAEFRALGTDAWARFDRVIASLHTAKSGAHAEAIQRLSYDIVIVDEAHHLKNRATVGWQFVNRLQSKYLLLLTATPAQNNLDELFNLITLLSPGQLKTPAAFRREFVARGDPRMPKNRAKLRQLLLDVMVRNTRSQVHVALPPRRAHTVRLTLSPEERALYDAVTEFVRREVHGRGEARLVARTLQAEAGSSAPALLATIETMRKRRGSALDDLRDRAAAVAASAKAGALLHLLRQRPDKVLIFTKYRATQRFLLEALGRAGVSAASFSGEMSAGEKDAQVAAFARDRQALVSTDVGSEGCNLQFCHTLVNYDLPWNPMQIEQRVGRVHRIGQTEPVTIFNLTAQDTLEDHVLEVLDSKINMFELVVGEVGEILGNLDEEREFEEIVLDLWMGAETSEAAHQAFDRLGERMVAARGQYLQSKAYDDALFGEDFTAEE